MNCNNYTPQFENKTGPRDFTEVGLTLYLVPDKQNFYAPSEGGGQRGQRNLTNNLVIRNHTAERHWRLVPDTPLSTIDDMLFSRELWKLHINQYLVFHKIGHVEEDSIAPNFQKGGFWISYMPKPTVVPRYVCHGCLV